MKKIYRVPENGMLAGVCAGLSEYFELDVSIIRLLWVIGIFAAGSAVLAYLVCAIVIPKKSDVYFND